ncbi:MAG: copper resistance protein CopC [Propionibacteriaceae bacterium]|jgi:methionine-rich copper-binding protein CopC|nr:copper resistance protein CopC [Propionibacteriaceae bacterium]
MRKLAFWSLVALFAAAPSAWADDEMLDMAVPQSREVLDAAPGVVSLTFTTPADASWARILVLNAAGENVALEPPIVEAQDVTVYLDEGIPEGTYTVYYRIYDGDEPRGGSYEFAVGHGDWTLDGVVPWAGEENEPAILREDDPPGWTPESGGYAEEPGVAGEEVGVDAGVEASEVAESEAVESVAPESSAANPSPDPLPASALPALSPWVWAAPAMVVLALVVGIIVRAIRRREPGGERFSDTIQQDVPDAPKRAKKE